MTDHPDTPLDFITLARNVRRLRQHREWSQQQLADECQLHRTTIIKIEQGEHHPSLTTVAILARALGTHTWILFFDDSRCSSSSMRLLGMFRSASAQARKVLLDLARRINKAPTATT